MKALVGAYSVIVKLLVIFGNATFVLISTIYFYFYPGLPPLLGPVFPSLVWVCSRGIPNSTQHAAQVVKVLYYRKYFLRVWLKLCLYFLLITKTLLQVNAGKAAGCRGHRMTEREEDEELLSDHNNDKANVISFIESPAYIQGRSAEKYTWRKIFAVCSPDFSLSR